MLYGFYLITYPEMILCKMANKGLMYPNDKLYGLWFLFYPCTIDSYFFLPVFSKDKYCFYNEKKLYKYVPDINTAEILAY